VVLVHESPTVLTVAQRTVHGRWQAMGWSDTVDWDALTGLGRVELIYVPQPLAGTVARLWQLIDTTTDRNVPMLVGAAFFADGYWSVTGEEEVLADDVLRRSFRVEVLTEGVADPLAAVRRRGEI
jgi:hypothetical protein